MKADEISSEKYPDRFPVLTGIHELCISANEQEERLCGFLEGADYQDIKNGVFGLYSPAGQIPARPD